MNLRNVPKNPDVYIIPKDRNYLV
eukprot:SAG11_NODE_12573_length_696_cov_1.790620_1_plen_23_part_01